MRILLDTNIVLDILLKREGLFDESYKVVEHAIKRGDKMFISSSAVTDIYYIIKKETSDHKKALDGIKRLAALMDFAEVNEKCILSAIESKIGDYEDAVIDAVAKTIKASFIVTRNIRDFKKSEVEAIPLFYYLAMK